jgi:hypothetical protein
MFPMNPGGTLKSIRAKIAFPASSAVTTAAGCVLVCVHAAATRESEQIQGTVNVNYNPFKSEGSINRKNPKSQTPNLRVSGVRKKKHRS